MPGARATSIDASRKVPRGADDEQALSEDIIALAGQYERLMAIAG